MPKKEIHLESYRVLTCLLTQVCFNFTEVEALVFCSNCNVRKIGRSDRVACKIKGIIYSVLVGPVEIASGPQVVRWLKKERYMPVYPPVTLGRVDI
jgi:hypothetical protein